MAGAPASAPERGPLSADVQWNVVRSAGTYPKSTGGPIEYVTVRREDGTVLGHVWRSLDGAAVAFLRQESREDDAYNVATAWATRLKAAHARGLTADEAWKEALEEAPAGLGRFDAATVVRAGGIEELRALPAGSD